MPEIIAFVLSTGRTGTKALAEGLAGDGVFSPHQPPYSRLLTIASNYYLHGWLPESSLRWLVNKVRLPQILASDCRYYVQVFSLDHLPAKIICEQYPDVRIVHIVRDPRTFVPSYLNWMHTRFKSYVANKCVPGWHPSGYHVGEMSWQEWGRMGEFERVCWQWSYKNRKLEHLFSGSAHYLRIRFEDLFLGGECQSVFKSMISFMGIPYHARYASICQQKKNISRQVHCPRWDEWQPERQRQLLNFCGTQMVQYGYDVPIE